MTTHAAVGVAVRYALPMPKRSSKDRNPNGPAAANGLRTTTHIMEASSDNGKDPAAVALGRKGGLKGGKARAATLTAQQRSEAARHAAHARWSKG
jgi:hypothetical protein